MEILLEDIKRTLKAKRIYLPGSAEHTLFANKAHRHAVKASSPAFEVDDLEMGVQGLGIVDSAVDMRSTLGTGPPRSSSGGVWMSNGRLDFPHTSSASSGGGESDKENLPVMRSQIMKVKSRRGGGLEMAIVP
jgi:hypothetical protein